MNLEQQAHWQEIGQQLWKQGILRDLDESEMTRDSSGQPLCRGMPSIWQGEEATNAGTRKILQLLGLIIKMPNFNEFQHTLPGDMRTLP